MKGGAFMNFYANIMKKMLDFPKKIRHLTARSLIFRIRYLLGKEEEGVIIVEREEFAREVREEFRGNTELLKAIEKGMNKYAGKNEYVSLTD